MKRLILFLTAVCMSAAMSAVTVNYTADNESIFANPERGFITMLEGYLTENAPYGVSGSENELDAHESEDKGSLILVHYYLDKFKTTPQLPAKILNAFDEDMQVLRSKGFKAIIRFSYADSTYINGNGEETAGDATLEIALGHIEQYKSHWQANADVIFCFQAGIVGAWGEWYYTDNFDNKETGMNASRRALVDALLEAVPADRCVQLRTPLFKTSYLEDDAAALTAEEAYQNTPKARLGHHNDAFLYGEGNMGTYDDPETQKAYIAQETFYVPIGGESNIEDEDLAAEYASKEKTIAEMSRLHWTFISGVFAPAVTNQWRNDGTFDELNRRLGYRFQLVSGEYSSEVEQGGKLYVKMDIRNTGFAPLYNKRPAYIVLKNADARYVLPLRSDPRTWLPNNVETTVEEALDVPADVAEGEYQLYLYLPDAYESLASDGRYAVRLANADVWDAETGMNRLNATVSVSAKAEPEAPVFVLNKANVSAYSSDMSWYNTYYFDFGATDAPNTDRWAEWQIELLVPGKYQVQAEGYYPNGHQWKLELLNSSAAVYKLPETWDEGEQTETGVTAWNLSALPAGSYTLRVMNAMEWGQPKLKSITLRYNGSLPTDERVLHSSEGEGTSDSRAYDLLGRPVDASYHGVVIQNGRKVLRQ